MNAAKRDIVRPGGAMEGGRQMMDQEAQTRGQVGLSLGGFYVGRRGHSITAGPSRWRAFPSCSSDHRPMHPSRAPAEVPCHVLPPSQAADAIRQTGTLDMCVAATDTIAAKCSPTYARR